MKTFYLKILVAILIVFSIYISVVNFNKYNQSKNFQVLNQRQSIILQLPNSEYLEIIAKNDHLENENGLIDNPFSSNTKVQKNSNLENSIVRTNIDTEYIENREVSTRLARIIPKDSENLRVEIYANTQYTYEESLRYYIQLDYSNKVDFKTNQDKIYFLDNGCTVSVVGENTKYAVSDNNQSLILSRPYEPETIFKFNLNIKCK